MLVATLCFGAVSAKSLRNAGIPAEFPPSSFKGKQYVDSKGCVFVRAGISGNVTWIPRVSRSRHQICGQKPTFASAPVPTPPKVAAVVTPTPKPAPKPAPTRVAAPTPKPAPQRVVRAPVVKPTPQRVVRAPIAKPSAAPEPTSFSRPVEQAVPTPAPTKPRRVVRRVVPPPAVIAPTPAPQPVAQRPARQIVRQAGSACPAASTFSQAYINSAGKLAVRCGPQQKDPTGRVASAQTTTAVPQRLPRSQTRRVAAPKPTRAVAVATAAAAAPAQLIARIATPTKPPAGYETVWNDGRLNPNRARGTAQGHAQMEMVWTNTVPSRLIAVSTGQDVRRRVVIQRDRKGRTTLVDVAVSTKTAPSTAAAPASAATHRYVQVGTYGSAANARKAIGRLKSMGLPVQVSKVQSNGRSLQIVLAGPFKRQANLKAALSAAKRAGYRDAVLRR